MTQSEWTALVAQMALKLAPHLTAKQSVKIAETLVASESGGENSKDHPLWAYENANLRSELTDAYLRGVQRDKPELFRKAPTQADWLALQEAAAQVPWTPEQRLTAGYAARDLSPDDLLEKIPAGTTIPNKVAVNAPPVGGASNSWQDLDAEVQKRSGENPVTMIPSRRLAWHEAIKREREQQSPTDTVTHRQLQDVLAKAEGDESKLSPEARLSMHWAEQAAKESNGA